MAALPKGLYLRIFVRAKDLMDVLLDIMFHHGGNFEKDDEGKLRYIPDNLTCLVPGRTLETGLRNLNSDNELREMCFLAHKNNGLVDVYFEHGVSSPDYLQDQEETVGMDNTGVDVAEEEGATAKPPNNQKPKPPTNPKPKPATNQKPKPPTTSKLKPPTKPILPKSVSTATPNSTPKSTLKKKTPTTTHNFRPCTRSVAKGKAVMQARQEGGDALSSDSYDSDEDSLYKPMIEDSSSDDDAYDNDVCKAKTVKKDIIFKHAHAAAFAKDKDQVTVEDDAFVEEVSDGDVDLCFVGGTGDDAYNAYDPGADSDGTNSWHSEEMKTPPNSEDEGTDEESEDVCPVFKEGIRFGELQLEVVMKFNTKWDFKEAVREFTI
ncbi:hypothetical protein Ahy_B01g055628 [Arachis hypogaea]|uniref:PB1-like domain-containing protein n=1 Tax=Arachis hypogaea TaxID=3818 RepID=A0A445AWP9_ARAHY|nr:hypothetical protein Ahy_B01g055628 [Arachis hypogaea]